jgi:hypothetical protein
MYDISHDVEVGRIRPWDELALQGPATQTLDGSTYLLAPNPVGDETVRDAVVRQQGIGAYLRIRDINSSDYPGLRLTCSPDFAFFTRLAMTATHVKLHSYTPPTIPYTDEVFLNLDEGPEVFARDFGVMTAAEFLAEYTRWH